MGKESSKTRLLQKDPNLAALQERLDQKKAERMELQQKTKAKPYSKMTSNDLREKV